MRILRLPARGLLLWACFFLAWKPVQSADYVGSVTCSECHAGQYKRQADSHHAHSLRPLAGSNVAAMLVSSAHSPDDNLTYKSSESGVAVQEDGLAGEPILEWAFGAGAQGITPVGRLNGQYFEHRFSYYSREQVWAPTFGHPKRVSDPLARLGIVNDNKTISSCFNCHATAVERSASSFDLTHVLPGVQCERCHGPGSSHVKSAKAGEPKAVVAREVMNPGRFSAKAIVQICGECHRLPPPDSGDEPELENPVTVRFAPISLMASRCFRASKTLSCLTCHDPHEDAMPRTDLRYTKKCLDCHAGNVKNVKLCRRRERENCLPCHMQQASLNRYLRFTDHRIRVYQRPELE